MAFYAKKASPPAFYTIDKRLDDTRNRPSGFDYMRPILAFGVIWSHSMLLTGGDFSFLSSRNVFGLTASIFMISTLPMFFTLSGFLVAGSLERSHTLVMFFGLRVFRIMPALAVEVVLSAFVLGPLLTTVPLYNYFTDHKLLMYLLNIVGDIHYYLPGLFLSNHVTLVNGQLWTVPWELACYIVLAGLSITGIFQRRHWLILSVVGLYLIQIWLEIFKSNRNPEMMGGSALVISFVSGLLIYRYRDKIAWSPRLCVIMAVISVLLYEVPHGLRFAPLPLAYVTIYLGLLNFPRDRIILSGDYSYGLYLYGFPVQQAIVSIAPNLRHWYLNLLLAFPCAIVVAVASWWLVEKPVLGQRKQLKKLENWYLEKRSSIGWFRLLSKSLPITVKTAAFARPESSNEN
jgi:peptidoglycan/LPS O-acetylase OafA/YrhL